MSTVQRRRRTATVGLLSALLLVTLLAPASSEERRPVATPDVVGPLPGSVPGDRLATDLADTYPFFSTDIDLAGAGFVEEEFLLRGTADGYSSAGALTAEAVPYETRIVVRRPADTRRFNGTALVEWQNVTAGYDLDALWNHRHILREGYAWIGVSAQRVGVDQLRGWSPARYGSLDVTGDGAHLGDELSYDIFAQAAQALTAGTTPDPMGGLTVDTVLATGASQSAGRMTTYYDRILPQVEPVFDGYAFVVGSAPSRVGEEPVFHLLSETDVRSPVRRADSDVYRRWEVAGTAHSGWDGQDYRTTISDRDLPTGAPSYDCAEPPFSRAPMHHVTAAAYDHLVDWVRTGTPPPTAEPLRFDEDGVKVRDELGLATGGIQLSQVAVPTALNSGDNAGESFCRLFGTHRPFDEATLDELYPNRGRYVSAVRRVDNANVAAGYLPRAFAQDNHHEALASGVGR